jgi:hypothetical protein
MLTTGRITDYKSCGSEIVAVQTLRVVRAATLITAERDVDTASLELAKYLGAIVRRRLTRTFGRRLM